ncbi:hypothetical protein LDENG_00124900 [Lucifuga dentata]|nr:hypothetical protein LDENG_00124900 [Lucifuga dentata]
MGYLRLDYLKLKEEEEHICNINISALLLTVRSSVTMTTKRGLITDSFKVVKKAKRVGKREKRPPPSPPREADKDSVRDEELQKLRQFDLDWRFGPCTGISRLQRWERAKLHDLNPPEEIRELLLQHIHTDPEYNQSLWSDYPL